MAIDRRLIKRRFSGQDSEFKIILRIFGQKRSIDFLENSRE